MNYIGPFGNIAIGALFFNDADGSGLVNAGEEVVDFSISRALPIQPVPSLGFWSNDELLASISDSVASGDRIRMRADVTQFGNSLHVSVYLLNVSRGDNGWTLLGQNDSLALHPGKSLSDIDSIQVRFDSGNSFIDNILIRRLPIVPTPCELADMNGDGDTTPADFSSWVGCFNLGLAFPGCDMADQNQDGVLSPADFSAWVSNFVSCGS